MHFKINLKLLLLNTNLTKHILVVHMCGCHIIKLSAAAAIAVVVVVLVVTGSYSATPYSSPDRECITKVKIKHCQSR